MYSFSIVRIDQLCILALIISKNANCWLEVSTCTLAGSSLYAYGSSRNPANEYGRSNAVCREDYYTQVGKLVNSPHHKQCLSLMMKSMEHYWSCSTYIIANRHHEIVCNCKLGTAVPDDVSLHINPIRPVGIGVTDPESDLRLCRFTQNKRMRRLRRSHWLLKRSSEWFILWNESKCWLAIQH